MRGSGLWHAEQAWLGHVATDVLIEVENGRIFAVAEGVQPPADAVKLEGFTFPGLANVHSHVFQESLRGRTETGGGDFWEWRRQMFDAAQGWDRPSYTAYARTVFREMLHAGITAVGEFHYLHRYGNELGEALIDAARAEGIRITLLDACYLRGGLDNRPLEGVQRSFSDGDVDRWVARVDELRGGEGVHIGAAIHSVRAVDPASMRVVAAWARQRKAPLHMHLAEQPDRKSTRLNSSHPSISYAVFCLKKTLRRTDGSSSNLSATLRILLVEDHEGTNFFFLIFRRPQRSTLFPYTTLFR